MYNIVQSVKDTIEELYLSIQFIGFTITIIMIRVFQMENFNFHLSKPINYLSTIIGIYILLKIAFRLRRDYFTKKENSEPKILLAVIDGVFITLFLYYSNNSFTYFYLLFHVYIIFQSVRFPHKSIIFVIFVSLCYIALFLAKNYNTSFISAEIIFINIFVIFLLSKTISYIFIECYKLSSEIESVYLKSKEEIEYLKSLSNKDYLTSMYNHRYFKSKYEKIIEHSPDENSKACLALFDIDDFKRINDTYGHLTGDLVLKEVSQIFRDNIRSCDIPARYGGEEFAIIFPNTSLNDCIEICERVRKSIEEKTFHLNNHVLNVTISCGVASLNNCTCSNDNCCFLNLVDSLLYKAKNSGKNQVRCS